MSAVVDAETGVVVQRMDYDAFGRKDARISCWRGA